MLVLTLDAIGMGADNGCAAFNSAAEIGVSNTMADKPLHSGIFTSVHTTDASSMAGRGGSSFGCAGSHSAGTPILSRTRHPQLALSGGLLKPTMEAFAMPSHVRTLLAYITLVITVIAFERNTPFIVVALSFAVFVLSHVIGSRDHA